MQFLSPDKRPADSRRRIILAAGFFDGVHNGHRAILKAMVLKAVQCHATPAVFTFRNHPSEILSPKNPKPLLQPPILRLSTVKSFIKGIAKQVEPVILAPRFTSAFASMTPNSFLEYLKKRLPGLDTVFCGADWTFGKNAAGNPAFLKTAGLKAITVPYAKYKNIRISSSRIRSALADGDLRLASAMLGRPWQLEGGIFSGKGFGTKLGFPTVNVSVDKSLALPPLGVYHVKAAGCDAIANLGKAPTTGHDAWPTPVLEIHILDFDRLAAPVKRKFTRGKLQTDFISFIRPEKKFASAGALAKQIAHDIAFCRSTLQN